jgi:hypothetical protein
LSGNPFWLTAGGARTHDIGISVPLFSGDITLRGGIYGMMFTNNGASTVAVKVYVGRTVAKPSYTIPSSSNIGWDPSLEPDLTKNQAKYHWNTSYQLEPGETAKIERRVSIQKIDQTVWIQSGYMPIVIVEVYNINTAGTQNVGILQYYNMSFSGDAIGTT